MAGGYGPASAVPDSDGGINASAVSLPVRAMPARTQTGGGLFRRVI